MWLCLGLGFGVCCDCLFGWVCFGLLVIVCGCELICLLVVIVCDDFGLVWVFVLGMNSS